MPSASVYVCFMPKFLSQHLNDKVKSFKKNSPEDKVDYSWDLNLTRNDIS